MVMKNKNSKDKIVTLVKSTSKIELNSEDIVNSFYENIVNTVREPLLILDENLRVVKSSKSFRDFFKVSSDETIGKLIYDLGDHQWDIPKLRELLETILPEKTFFDNFEVEHDFLSIGKRIMLLNARKIETAFGNEKIILLAIEDITSRKKAEESLMEKNRLNSEYLDALLEHANAPIIIWDSALRIKRFNQEFEKLSGYDSSEVIDKPIEILFPKDKIDLLIDLLKNNLNNNSSEAIEIDILTKEKIIKTVQWNSISIFDDDDKNIVATITQDITNRKQEENRLGILESRYRRLFESAKDGILILDAESGKIIDVNPFLCELLDYSKEKFINKELWQIGFFKDIAANKDKFLELQQKEYVRYADLPLETTDGRVINVEFISNVYLVNSHRVIQCNIRDITEHKKLINNLINSEARLRTLVQTIPDLIWLKDVNGVYLLCNPMFERFFGANEGDIIGKTDYDFVDKKLADFFRENDIKAMDAGKPTSNEELITFTDDGHQAYLETIKVPTYDADGKLVGVLGIGRDITERKQAEELLQETEERYRAFFENSMDGILLTSPDGKTISANQAACKMFGYSENELINIGRSGVVDTTDPNLSFLLAERAEKGKVQCELTFIRKDGTHFPCEISSAIFKNSKGSEYTSMIIRDISERIEIQNKIKFQVELLFNVGQAVIATDLLGKIIYWNHAAENIYGWTIDEAVGKNIIDITPVEQAQKQASEIMEQLITGNSWSGEFLVKRKDGSSFPSYVTDTPINDSNGKLIGVIGISSDITEKKLVEDKIILLAHALKSINECVSITDIEDKIIFVNESFLKTYGYDENELLGKNINMVRSVNNSPDLIKGILHSTFQGRWHGELWNKRKDGSEFQIYLSTTIIYDKENKILGLIGVAKDVTEAKINQQELIKAKEKAEESDKMKSEFLAQMSHEIRTPLNAVLGYTEYLSDLFGEPKDSEVIDCFSGVNLAANRIIRTIDLLLNTAEFQAGSYQPRFHQIDLDKDILNKLYKEQLQNAKQRGLELIYNCELNDSKILADEYSTIHIFANLIDNALNYTKKGKVEILLTKNEDDNVVVEIKDTGIGIAKDFLPKLFKPFSQEEQGYSRSFEGNGLGLALVKNYCDVNIALIEVESVKNVGSTFRIIFDKNNKIILN